VTPKKNGYEREVGDALRETLRGGAQANVILTQELTETDLPGSKQFGMPSKHDLTAQSAGEDQGRRTGN
jgi:hypothetical protein